MDGDQGLRDHEADLVQEGHESGNDVDLPFP